MITNFLICKTRVKELSKNLPALKLIAELFIFQSDSMSCCTWSPWVCRLLLQTPQTEQFPTCKNFPLSKFSLYHETTLILVLRCWKIKHLIHRKGAQKKRYLTMQTESHIQKKVHLQI